MCNPPEPFSPKHMFIVDTTRNPSGHGLMPLLGLVRRALGKIKCLENLRLDSSVKAFVS